jgi:hypothetical protein
VYAGTKALQAAAKLLPAINESGARREEVQTAVELVSGVAEPGQLFRRYTPGISAGPPPIAIGRGSRRRAASIDGGHVISNLPKEVRLALEMASHEEQERRALEGELALLEAAWRDAEEVAKIADDMFVSETTLTRLEALKNSV